MVRHFDEPVSIQPIQRILGTACAKHTQKSWDDPGLIAFFVIAP